jgi:hypothetical protein
MVSALGLAAVMVPDPPKETAVPLNVTLELVRAELGMLVSVLLAPLMDLFVRV